MFAVGNFYHHHGDHAFVTAALKGVAAAVGLILSTVVSLTKKSFSHSLDSVSLQ
jgi:chromate transporter